MSGGGSVLVLNCGSSSVKLAVLDPVSGRRSVTGLAERVGTAEVRLRLNHGPDSVEPEPDGSSAAEVIAALLAALPPEVADRLAGVGHRVVHGGARFDRSVLIEGEVREQLRALIPLAPLHNPVAIAGIEAVDRALPGRAQVAAFDTAFHHSLPPVAYRYAVPERWYTDYDVRRYGFHGLSYRYVGARAAELLARPLAELRLVVLHLGNGCSAVAIRDGRSIDTTMGMTPLEGLVMGTRSGDVDPGVLQYAAAHIEPDLDAVMEQLNSASGLLGLSGLSNDSRELLDAAEAGDQRAELAVDVFCYRAAKAVAALAVPLAGLDAVVFTGGIGEHADPIRSRILARLAAFGLAEDEVANARHGADTSGRISTSTAPVALVVPTDEELVVARDTAALVA